MPVTLLAAIRHYSDPDNCLEAMMQMRWPNGVACPTCGSKNVRFLKTRRLWECKTKHTRRQFSVKVGTIFEDSPIGLDKWFAAIWMLVNCKNGVSSYEIHRALGVTQKTAWFMLHRVRLAMQRGTFEKIGGNGPIEVDESFIGGLARNMHLKKRIEKGRTGFGKAVVMGLLDRETGHVRTIHVPNTGARTLTSKVRENVKPGTHVYTDAAQSYINLRTDYVHKVVDHAESYVKGNVHTNRIENFWSLLKRGIRGTYVSVEPFHLFRYLDEQALRFNTRKAEHGDGGRFLHVLSTVTGKRLTYKELTGDDRAAEGSILVN